MKKSNFLAMLIAAKLEADTKPAAEAGASDFWCTLPDYNPSHKPAGNVEGCYVRLVRISDHQQNSHKGGLIIKNL